MSNSNNAEIARKSFETICRVLDEHEWKYTKHPEDMVVVCSARGDDIPMEVVTNVDEGRMNVKARSILPFEVPEDKRIDFALAISTINTTVVNGCFEYDISAGRVLFRISNSLVEGVISDDAVLYIYMAAFHIIDEYNDKLLMLAKGVITIEQFIASVSN